MTTIINGAKTAQLYDSDLEDEQPPPPSSLAEPTVSVNIDDVDNNAAPRPPSNKKHKKQPAANAANISGVSGGELILAAAAAAAPSSSSSLIKVPSGRFYFKTGQTQALATLLMCWSTMFETVRMVISKDGIQATCMNLAKTCMSRWVMSASQAVEGVFHAPAVEQEITADVPELSLLMAAASRADTLCMYLDNEDERDQNSVPEQLVIDFMDDDGGAETKGPRGHMTMALNNPEEFYEIDTIEYSNQVSLSSDAFNSRLHTKNDSKSVTFDLKSDAFTVVMSNSRAHMSFSWPLDAQSDTVASDIIQTPQKFHMQTILNIMRITKATRYVSISMPEKRDDGTVKPLCMNFQLAALGVVSFFVAPQLGGGGGGGGDY